MKVLFVAPHPDDELLGCGGTILRRVAEGDSVGWLLITTIPPDSVWKQEDIIRRKTEIDNVRKGLGISSENLFQLAFPAAQLDQVSTSTFISSISRVFHLFQPQEVFLPHPGDIHSDHHITFKAASACTKWFRYPFVKRVLTYETLSETDFGLDHSSGVFTPNLFIDITSYLSTKLQLLQIYKSEMGVHPFPRSIESVKAQSILRGCQSGVLAAEAFQILRSFE